MGMFDEVDAINISHSHFDESHNGLSFQTRDLSCNSSEYCIFNGVLYQQDDGSERHPKALKSDYSGTLNIYTQIEEDDIESWVEYDLEFNEGELINVTPHEIRVTRDNRDLSARRPGKPQNRVEITISLSDCDSDKRDAFIDAISDEKINAIRNILGEPTATVFYPARRPPSSWMGYPSHSEIMSIASVVQTKEDFESSINGGIKVTAPNGDKISIIKD